MHVSLNSIAKVLSIAAFTALAVKAAGTAFDTQKEISVHPSNVQERLLTATECQQHLERACCEMDNIIAALREISSGHLEESLPGLAAAVQRYHEQKAPILEHPLGEFPPVTEEFRDFHERQRVLGHRMWAQQAELSRLLDYKFVSLLRQNEQLCYHLLLQSPYLELPLSSECREDLSLNIASAAFLNPEHPLPEHLQSIFAEAAPRHNAFLHSYSNQFSGGNGSAPANAILLQAQGREISPEQVLESIRFYMRSVYPQPCSYSISRMPDINGSAYIVPVRFSGLQTLPDGTRKIICQAIWFRCK